MITFRKASKEDIEIIVKMLADDPLGSKREDSSIPLNSKYVEAFEEVLNQSGNQIIIASKDSMVVGCLQLTFIPGIARLGAKRALIEAVRVSSQERGQGIGEALFKYAIELSKQEDCQLVQLTTDLTRDDALRFYQKLGFEETHRGMKLML